MSAPNQPSVRDHIKLHVGQRLAGWLGPYPDEVGWLISVMAYFSKLTCLGMIFWMLVDLVFPEALADLIAGQLILFGLATILLAWLMPTE